MRWRCQHLERVKEVISGTQVADLDEPDRDLLHSTAAAAALAPAKEGRFLLPGEGGRPADILIPGWSNGRDAALDVTVKVGQVLGAMPPPGHHLPATCCGKSGSLAPQCSGRGEKAGKCLGQAHGGGGEQHNLPPVPEAIGLPGARKCCPFQQSEPS